MLTLIFIIFVIMYFARLKRNAVTEEEKNKKYGWNLMAWILIICVVFHGC